MTGKSHLTIAIVFIVVAVGFSSPASTAGSTAAPPGTSKERRSAVRTFNKDIAPIVFEHCAACHRPGESAPFSLLSYQEVKKRARQVVGVTKSRFMPPWLPEPGNAEFMGERRLSDEQLLAMQQWVAQGAIEGDPADLPLTPKWTEGWQLGEPDLVIMLDQPYTLPSEGTDVFRNFVIPIPVSERRYVKTVEFRPGNPKIVHHVVMSVDDTPSSRQLDEQEPGSGFEGMYTVPTARVPDGQFLGWLPGKSPNEGTEGMAWRLDRGTDLVLQLHMLPTGKPEMIQPTVGFFFTDQPPTLVPYILRLGDQTIDIPAGRKHYVIEDSYVLPVDVEVLSVYPHAHFLCKQMEGFATLPDGSTRRLIRIPDWDFNWQDQYRYAKPIALPRGTVLGMRHIYDNSSDNVRNPHHPPRRVVYGPQSYDEMGDLWIQVLPRSRDDLETLSRDFSTKEMHANMARDRKCLELDPLDAKAHYNLGNALQLQGRLEDAISHYREALRIRPELGDAHYNLGNALSAQDESNEAIAHYRQALRINPDFPEAHYNLGVALQVNSDIDGAIVAYRQAVRANPDYGRAHNNLGIALQSRGQVEQAIGHFRQAVQITPDDAQAHNNLGVALQSRGRIDQAIRYFREALRIRPRNIQAMNNLGVAVQMRGQLDEAMGLYRRALEIKPDDANTHYNLGLVCQSQGRFDQAVGHYRRALQIEPKYAQARNNLATALQLQGKLDEAIGLYRQMLKAQPNETHTLKNLALALGAKGQINEAADLYLQVLRIAPHDANAHYALGGLLQSQGRVRDAMRHFREAIRIRPSHVAALNRISRILATHPRPGVRDAGEAVRLAERAAELSHFRNPVVLDTLACAHAEAGRFERAVATGEAALGLATAKGADDLGDQIRSRLQLFRQSKPYRETVRAKTEGATR